MRFGHRLALALLLSFEAASTRAQSSLQKPGDTLAFVNVNVIPMDAERTFWRRTVLVADGRIIAVGSVDSIKVPASATKVDGEDRLFVLPGLADMHVHLRYETDLQLLLANGVTTVRNMRGTPFHLELRRRVANGTLPGPRIVTAGPVLRGEANSGATPANARAMVDSQAAVGYDFIKTYDGLPKASYEAAVDEAAKHHLPVAGHIPTAVGVLGALQAHHASIEHVEQIANHYFGDEFDAARVPLIARAIARAHTYVTPTIAFIRTLELQWDSPDSILARPEIKYVDPETYAWWRTDRGHSSALNHVFEPFLQRLIRAFRDADVPMLAGTDFYLFGMTPGFGLHRELQALVEAGLTPYQALETATRNPAQFLGEAREAGTVTIGNVANLLILNADPLVDIRNTTHRAGVVVRGRWLTAQVLDRGLDSLWKTFKPEARLVDELLVPGAGRALRSRRDSLPHFQQSTLSLVGASLLSSKRVDDAVGVYELITKRYPASAAAYDELGDAYVAAGGKVQAIRAYERALQLDPKAEETSKKLAQLRGH